MPIKLRVLVVDDTILFRKVLSDALNSIPNVEVVGTAANGRIALQKIDELKPDLITLDIEMPGMNGLQVLEEIRKNGYNCGVIIVSSFTVQGGDYTIKALERGAFDFITKPTEGSIEQNRTHVHDALVPPIRTFQRRREISSILHGENSIQKPVVSKEMTTAMRPSRVVQNGTIKRNSTSKIEMILIGVSTGGPAALALLIPTIPVDINVPVIIIQHMPPLFTKSLAESLNNKSLIHVKEAEKDDILRPGVAYIAPGGKQMKIVLNNNQREIIINDDPPENNCKPSVDYTFRSIANNLQIKCISIILTGMGSDGTLGLRLLKRHGSYTIAQNEASCVVYGMPKAAVEANVVDEILPLEHIGSRITTLLRKGVL
jgi:two-component system chemotaxis response regulator CheB